MKINAAMRLLASPRITDSAGEAELSRLYRKFRNPRDWNIRWLDSRYLTAIHSDNDTKYLCVYEESLKPHAEPNESASGSFVAVLKLSKLNRLSRLTGRATYTPWVFVTLKHRGNKLAERLYELALNGEAPMLASDEDQADAARALWKKLARKYAFLNLGRTTLQGTPSMQTIDTVAKDSRILTLMCGPLEFDDSAEFAEWATRKKLLTSESPK